MENFTFLGKNLLRAWLICRIERALYAKTSHPHVHRDGIRGVLPKYRFGVGVFGTKAEV